MVGRFVTLSWAGLVAALAMGAATATAQDDDAARMHFQAGRSYYDAAEYESALREFLRAHELSERPQLFYNISLCYQQLDRLDEAVEYLERYLSEVDEIANRATLERRLENFRDELAEQRSDGADAEPDAEPDTEPQPSDEPSEPAASDDPVSAAPQPRSEPGASAPAAPPDDETSGGGLPALSWVGFVAAGAGVVTMGTFGIMALREKSSVADGCGATVSCSSGDVSKMDTFALVSDIGLGIAVAGAAVGVVGLLLGDGESEAPASASVSPWVAPRGGGASVRGAF